MALLVTSFHMSSYSQARGNDPGLTPKQANEQGVDMAKEAIKIFQKARYSKHMTYNENIVVF